MQDVLRVRDAVTPNGGIWVSLAAIVVVYGGLGLITLRVLRSMSRRWRDSGDADLATPYGPPAEHDATGHPVEAP